MELPEWTIQENTFMANNKEYKYYQIDNQGNLVGDIPFASGILDRYGGVIDFKIFTKPNTYTSYKPGKKVN